MHKIYEQANFWYWVFTLGTVELSTISWQELKKNNQYKVKEKIAEDAGKSYKYQEQTLQLDFPITPYYGFTGLLLLDGKSVFSELLYLRVGELYYLLGWHDPHSHHMVFRMEEWEQVLYFLEQTIRDKKQIAITALYLSRFVPALDDQLGKQLAEKSYSYYQELLQVKQPIQLILQQEEFKEKWLRDNLYEMDYQPRAVKVVATPLEFIVEQRIEWVEQKDGSYYLEGSPAYSIRTALYNKNSPIAVTLERPYYHHDKAAFPEQHWQAFLQTIHF